MSNAGGGGPRRTVGGRERSKGASAVWFGVGVAAVAISVAVLLFVVVGALGGDGDSPASTATTTPTTSATTSATAGGNESSPAPNSTATTPPTNATPATPEATETPTVMSGEFPLVDCLDLYARADKKHIMSPNCAPSDLVPIPNSGEQMRSEAAAAFNEMVEAAADDDIVLLAVSGYRSYQTQEVVYASAVAGYGQEYADRTSARPGHSEHQLGTVMDVSTPSEGGELEESFGDTPAGIWVKENSYKYGFIVSYPEGTEAITGYAYEPWHIRYLRKDVAKQVHDSGLTTTEFLAKR